MRIVVFVSRSNGGSRRKQAKPTSFLRTSSKADKSRSLSVSSNVGKVPITDRKAELKAGRVKLELELLD